DRDRWTELTRRGHGGWRSAQNRRRQVAGSHAASPEIPQGEEFARDCHDDGHVVEARGETVNTTDLGKDRHDGPAVVREPHCGAGARSNPCSTGCETLDD